MTNLAKNFGESNKYNSGILNALNLGVINLYISAINYIFWICVAFFMLGLSIKAPQIRNTISIKVTQYTFPIVKLAYFPVRGVQYSTHLFFEVLTAIHENKRLKEENINLKSSLMKYTHIQEQENETENLRNGNSVFGVLKHFKIAYISQSGSATAIIATYDEKIPPYSPVLINGEMVGRTIGDPIGGLTKIMFVNNPNSYIPVKTASSKIKGVLAGNGAGTQIIYQTGKPFVGEIVTTMSENNLLAADIPIGIVSFVDEDTIKVSQLNSPIKSNIVSVLVRSK